MRSILNTKFIALNLMKAIKDCVLLSHAYTKWAWQSLYVKALYLLKNQFSPKNVQIK